MNNFATAAFVACLIVFAISNSPAQSVPQRRIEVQVDWPQFLESKDLIWSRLPRTWKEAPFLGNGEQGTMMYQTDNRTIRWDVGCSAAHDHRPAEQDDFTEKNVSVLNRGRHFIGHLEMRLPADIKDGTGRLSLWNAECDGTLNSENGQAKWRSLVHAKQPVMYFELETTGNLNGAQITYVPAKAQNPRAVRAKQFRVPANPAPVVGQVDGIKTAVQNLQAGGQTAVAWLQVKTNNKCRIWLSVKHSFPEKTAVSQAIAAVQDAARVNRDQWLDSHRQWWHQFYQASFVSTGDGFWDTFYWVQQYKLACATRHNGWILDNQGPWLQPTAWNAAWWNLNVQVAHSGFATANRRGMGTALSHRLGLCRENLTLNVAEPYRVDSSAIGRSTSGWDLRGHAGQPGKGRPPLDPKIGRECGNLLWALHNVDLEYRYWNDPQLRDDILFPLLVRAVNYYRHFLVEEADGRLHLPKTYSPEYRFAEDCTYDIDLLRWGAGRLLELATEKKLTENNEPLVAAWKEIMEKLVPVHVNETGRMIGRNVSLKGPHRHWSHLLAIYPLRTLPPTTPVNRKLIQHSLDHWHSAKRPMAGYSVTGGSCMASLLGDGDQALRYLNRLKPFLHVNTFYSEAGGLPVIETPLHGATAIQEMLLQSWGGRLRVFPAVPTSWPDVQFHQFRGAGAFLVSAKRTQGRTEWVYIKSETDNSVEVDLQIQDTDWVADKGITVGNLENGIYTISMPAGSSVVFWPKSEQQPACIVEPISPRDPIHRFGLPKN